MLLCISPYAGSLGTFRHLRLPSRVTVRSRAASHTPGRLQTLDLQSDLGLYLDLQMSFYSNRSPPSMIRDTFLYLNVPAEIHDMSVPQPQRFGGQFLSASFRFNPPT